MKTLSATLVIQILSHGTLPVARELAEESGDVIVVEPVPL